MGWWTEHVLPHAVDRVLSIQQINDRREEVCRHLTGRVLEIGFGSGLNVAFYPATVAQVLAVEPSSTAWRLGAERIASTPIPVIWTGLDAGRIDLADASVDAVLSTYTLCTVSDSAGVLSEIRRVLRPGSSLHFLEHGRAPDPSVAAWQRRIQPLHSRLAGGCRLNVPIVDEIVASGLELVQLETEYGVGPRLISYTFAGRARRPS